VLFFSSFGYASSLFSVAFVLFLVLGSPSALRETKVGGRFVIPGGWISPEGPALFLLCSTSFYLSLPSVSVFCFFPLSRSAGGHAIMYIAEREEKDKWGFVVANTGQGGLFFFCLSSLFCFLAKLLSFLSLSFHSPLSLPILFRCELSPFHHQILSKGKAPMRFVSFSFYSFWSCPLISGFSLVVSCFPLSDAPFWNSLGPIPG
jgi:hypothetical protein